MCRILPLASDSRVKGSNVPVLEPLAQRLDESAIADQLAGVLRPVLLHPQFTAALSRRCSRWRHRFEPCGQEMIFQG